MRRFTVTLGLVALALAGCSPQTLTMSLDMRYPSKSGINLARKTISVVYMEGDAADSTFSNGVASAFARSLEEDYFAGEEAIGVYKIPGDSVSLDLMHRLVIDTGDDVVFLLGPPSFGEVSLSEKMALREAVSVDSAFVNQAHIPFNAKLFVYDSMDKSDQMQAFRGSNILRTQVFSNGVTAPEYLKKEALKAKDLGAELVGKQLSNRFVPVWKTENYSLYYFDGWDDGWQKGALFAHGYYWKEAADSWMGLLKEKNLTKRAAACYNIALAFFMMGDLDLASKWLDKADALGPLELSPGLRKRIEARR